MSLSPPATKVHQELRHRSIAISMASVTIDELRASLPELLEQAHTQPVFICEDGLPILKPSDFLALEATNN